MAGTDRESVEQHNEQALSQVLADLRHAIDQGIKLGMSQVGVDIILQRNGKIARCRRNYQQERIM